MTKQLLTIGLVAGLLLSPLQDVFAQQAKPALQKCSPTTGCPPPPMPSLSVPAGVSLAVAQVAQAALLNVSNKMNANTITASDYASAATASQAMFANFDEAGFTILAQTFVVQNAALFTTNPTQTQIDYAYNSAKSAGSQLTETQFENILLSSTLAERQAFFASVQQGQLQAVLGYAITGMQQLAAELQNGKNGARYILAATKAFGFRAIGLYLAVVGLVVATGGAGAIGLGVALGIAGVGFGSIGEVLEP